jgi:hypothetical protein
MTNLSDNLQFLLDNDAIENSQYRVYTKSGNAYTQLLQSNGSNPKVKQMTFKEKSFYYGIVDKLPEYSVRIIKDPSLTDAIAANKFYYLSFDGGVTAVEFVVTSVEESKQQDLFWRLILTRTSDAHITL